MPKTILILVVTAIGLVGVSSVIAYKAFGSQAKPSVVATTESIDKEPAAAVPDQAKPENKPQLSQESPIAIGASPVIISRKEWKAKELRGEGKPHTINCITIHHTAVNQNKKLPIETKLQNLQRFSQNEERLASGKMKPSWLDVPYHFYIAVDGKIAEGRPIKFASDTNTEYDPTGHATIVVEGNFENEQPTAEQVSSLQAMLAWLTVKYEVPAKRISAHNDHAKTACPGVNLKAMLPGLRDKVAEGRAKAE